jgi:3D (Asp-Asp-Asp) domain-containing protein
VTAEDYERFFDPGLGDGAGEGMGEGRLPRYCRLPEPFIGAGGWGKRVGKFQQTYYWVVDETECRGEAEVEIYDKRGRVLALVSEDFACKLGLEGSGRLSDGRIVNYWGTEDDCPRVTVCKRPYYPSENCYQILNPERYPWGKGVWRRSLRPFKSIAVDPHVIPYGAIVYLPAYDGYVLPDGTVHDGCVRADDTGGAIIGDQIDFFAGTEWHYHMMNGHFPRRIEVRVDPKRCPWDSEWFEAVGAGCCDDKDCPYAGGVCLGEPYFPGGYCSLETCEGKDCPDVGGYFAFCTNHFSGGTCVQRCFEDRDCRAGYVCRELIDLGGGTGMGCIPE